MITPIEIRQQTFKRRLRGYDPDEVRAFLHTLSEEWEHQMGEMRKLKEEQDKLQAKYSSLKELENMLHKTLMQAEQSSKNTMENARQKAELKVREAESKARDIVRRGIDERNRLEGEIITLKSKQEELLNQLHHFLKSHMDSLSTFERKELSPPKTLSEPRNVPSRRENLFGNEEDKNPNGSIGGNLFDDIVNEL